MATPKSTREIVSNTENVICGDLDNPVWRAQKGRQIVGWNLKLDPTYPILNHILPLMGITDLGADTFELGATDEVVNFRVNLDFGDYVHDIADAYTSRYAFRGSKGSRPISMEWDLIGSQEISGSFTGTPLPAGSPFAFTHTSYDLANANNESTTRATDRFLIQVNNNLVVEHNNSILITDATIGHRESIFATSVPTNSDNEDLYFDYRDDEDGKNCVVIWDNGEKTVRFDMPKGIAVAKPPSIEGSADIIRTPVTMLLHRGLDGENRVAPLKITMTDSTND